MQNKANFQKSQVNVKLNISRDYEKKSKWTLGENKPNSNPISKAKKMLLRLFTFVFTRAFLLSHYLVEFCRGNDRMLHFKMQEYESYI